MSKEKKLTKKEDVVVQKKLQQILYERAKKQGASFGGELKKHSLVAITVAFGFLIALAWKDPIVALVELIVARIGVAEGVYAGIISAVVVTIIAVLGLMALSKWAVEGE